MEATRAAGYHHHQFQVLGEMKHCHVLKGQRALKDLLFSFLINYTR